MEDTSWSEQDLQDWMNELRSPAATLCAACGSDQGPDRRARWETGEADLDAWLACPECQVPLCDSCDLSGIHQCELTACVRYAYNPRQGARSRARYHAVLDRPLEAGRLRRAKGDALCRPRAKFWGLAAGAESPVTCPDCLRLAGRFGVIIREERN